MRQLKLVELWQNQEVKKYWRNHVVVFLKNVILLLIIGVCAMINSPDA